jgi:signal peptidase II
MPADANAGGDDLDEASVATTRNGVHAPRGVMARGPRWALFTGLALAIVVADQLTKKWIVEHVDPARPSHLLGDYVRLIVSHNNGALFGLFQGQATLFALASFAVIALIVGYHARTNATVMTVALGLLLGGAIGNVADRLRYGYVVDFVDAGIGPIRWYTFNVADSAISLALILLVLVAIRPSLAAPREITPDGATDG